MVVIIMIDITIQTINAIGCSPAALATARILSKLIEISAMIIIPSACRRFALVLCSLVFFSSFLNCLYNFTATKNNKSDPIILTIGTSNNCANQNAKIILINAAPITPRKIAFFLSCFFNHCVVTPIIIALSPLITRSIKIT